MLGVDGAKLPPPTHKLRFAFAKMLRKRRAARRSSLDTGVESSADRRLKSTFGTARAGLVWIVRVLPYIGLAIPLCLIFYVLLLSPKVPPPAAADLGTLVSAVQGVLQLENITHWLAPGAELLSATETRASFTRHHRSIVLGLEHGRSMAVLIALSEADAPLASVETHAGLRVFFRPEVPDPPAHVKDFHEPFVDLHPYRPDGALFVNACCKCGRATVSACTKKLCACRACAHHKEALFPLRAIKVAGVAHALPAPRALGSVLLDVGAPDLPGVLGLWGTSV